MGVVAGPLALGASTALDLGWRGLYFVFAGLTVVLLALTRRIYPTALSHTRKESGRTPDLSGIRLNKLRTPHLLIKLSS